MDSKEVTFFAYYDELDAIRKELMDFSLQKGLGSDTICLFNRHMGDIDAPIEIVVNWTDTGNHSVDEAESFAKVAEKAAKLARNFKYNGYVIVYERYGILK